MKSVYSNRVYNIAAKVAFSIVTSKLVGYLRELFLDVSISGVVLGLADWQIPGKIREGSLFFKAWRVFMS
jgi:hypothetical protein